MIKFDGDSSYYIPNQSRNRLSQFEISKLCKDNFKIQTKVKIDWDKLDTTQRANGIVVLNGMDMGIFCKLTEDGKKLIMAETWTQVSKIAEPEQLVVGVEGDTFDIELDYILNKKMTLTINGQENLIDLKTQNVVDYSSSTLWIGCCNNSIYEFEYVVPEFLKGNLNGEMYSLKIYSRDKVVAEYDFEEQTEFKVRDISNNGNNLLRKVIDEDLGNLVLY